MDRGAWSVTLHGVAELVTTEVTELGHANFLQTKTPENLFFFFFSQLIFYFVFLILFYF